MLSFELRIKYLNQHVATIHEGEKQFKYGICDASFGQKSNLNKDVATIHEAKKKINCKT